jgi:hypothetical protein
MVIDMRKFTNGKGIVAEFDDKIPEQQIQERLSWLMGKSNYWEIKE